MSKKDELIGALKELEASGELEELDELDELDAMAIFPLPPRKNMHNMHIFLIVTLSTLILSGLTIASTLNFVFFRPAPEVAMSILFTVSLIFCFLNFKITRGSFKSAFYLKIYLLILTFLALFPLLTFNPIVEMDKTILSFFQISSGLLAFYFISSKKYSEFVRAQYDYMNEVKEIQNILKKYKLIK